MLRAALRFFLQTLKLARQTCLRRRAHSIDEKNPIQMVDLVLNRARQESSRFDFDRLAV